MGANTIDNKIIEFVQRPNGRPSNETFRLKTKTITNIESGEFLIRNCFLSMDPALVGRMRDEDNYIQSVNPGEVMHCYAIGQVVESKHPKVKVGELRLGIFGMQEYFIGKDPNDSNVINLGLAEASHYLSAVGITGTTAYFSLFDIGKPKSGETIIISAGGSSVGSLVAQLTKQQGCRTVAIVSTEEKAQQVKNDWGYDAAVSYRNKTISELSKDIGLACPNGVDIYYDNTSGDISEAVLDHYNEYARVAIVGRLAISHLSDTRLDTGRRENSEILSKRIKKQGFVLLDYQDRMKGAVIILAKAVKEGHLRIQEDIAEGIENTPDAFFKMLDGRSKGKQLVKLADIDHKLDPCQRWLGKLVTARLFPTRAIARILAGGIG